MRYLESVMQRRCKCLVLGPQGTGKSLLVKKLKAFCNDKQSKNSDGARCSTEHTRDIFPTLPTVGATVDEIELGKGRTCFLREYGGCMAPVWSAGYDDCDLIAYVIDASNCTQISAATILLLEVLSHAALQDKPFLVIFNKTDIHCPMSLTEYKSIMRLNDIVKHAAQSVQILEGSCVEGISLTEQVLHWIHTYLHNALNS